MALITFREIIDLIIMVLALGFIFRNMFRIPSSGDPLLQHKKGFWETMKIPMLLTAPGIIFHEFAHKFVAMALGYQASFFAACSAAGLTNPSFLLNLPCMLLIFGVISSMTNFGFVFFIPGYVAHTGVADPLHAAAIAFAGPFLNLVFWAVPMYILRFTKVTQNRPTWKPILSITAKINLFLFFFNMIPIPPFDGATVFFSLFQAIP